MTIRSDTPALYSSGWTLATALQLGRVSNLPTVWSNVLAAVIICGAQATPAQIALLIASMSLAYTGGMFLNDAFDRRIDAKERPERPIPSGKVPARDVFIIGFAMLVLSVGLVLPVSANLQNGHQAIYSAAALSACIILYNLWHKNNPVSPILMGICRLLIYVTCSYALTGEMPNILLLGALIILCYLIGLTYTAKQANREQAGSRWPPILLTAPVIMGIYCAGSSTITWLAVGFVAVWTVWCLQLSKRNRLGDFSSAIAGLIAGVSLIDALLIVCSINLQAILVSSTTWLCLGFCYAAFALTLRLQRHVSGT